MGHYLILGRGSIGRRHESILRDLGHTVVTVDPNPKTGADYQSLPAFYATYCNGTLDCTPPDVRASKNVLGQAVFIEKPLGNIIDPRGTFALIPVQMGFCYRWIPSLEEFVDILKGADIYSLALIGGQRLQDWHKEDYRDVAYRYKGVVMDSMPHSLYIARWILGNLELVGSVAGKVSDLEINVEDTAAVLLRTAKGQPCYLLADYLRDPRAFWIEAVTSAGWKRWEFSAKEDVDVMYRRQMETFVRLAGGKAVGDYPNLEDGIAVQKLLDRIVEANGGIIIR